MSTQATSKHHGKPKLRKTDRRHQPPVQTRHRSELERAQELARLVRETRARAEAQVTSEAEEKARSAREAVRARRPERDRDAIGEPMVDALCRGCGVSDILERAAAPNDDSADSLRRAQRLDGLLAELGPCPREEGGAEKSPRDMERTRAFLAALIADLQREVDWSCRPIDAASSRSGRAVAPQAGPALQGTPAHSRPQYGRLGVAVRA